MFKEKLHKKLALALEEFGFESPTKLQSKSISKINSGTDLIAIAPEGSGKSTLIIISAIHKLQEAFEDAPRALLLVTDMESALTMKAQFELLSKNTNLRAVAIFEEGKIDQQNEEIYSGTDHVIGTPKRALEIYFNKNMNLNKIKLFAIDDAEKMIKKSFQGQIDRLGLSLPKCQHLVFTENYNDKVEKLIHKFIVVPHTVEIKE